MSDGDETDSASEKTEEPPDGKEPADPGAFERRLDDVTELVETAKTEDDLDEAEETLDELEATLEERVFATPAPDDAAADETESEDDPNAEFESRLADLRDDVDDQRGPYVEDITDVLEDGESAITTSDWAAEGKTEVAEAVSAFFSTAGDALDESFELGGETPAEIAEELGEVRARIGETALDPDDDDETIATVLSAAETLSDDVDGATLWTDLEIREQLTREGFYDVLDPSVTKDFPPELSAINVYETRGDVEPLLSALEKFDSDFMEENILDALEHLAPEAAYEPVYALAQRRNKQPVRILGRIGDERARETLEDFLGGGDVELEKTTLRALGMIGSEESTEPIAQRLVADSSEIRSVAARALGLIGDTRAIDPLGDVLEADDADEVRASAAWALNQIGTERALETAASYADDRSYLVQAEAQKAMRV